MFPHGLLDFCKGGTCYRSPAATLAPKVAKSAISGKRSAFQRKCQEVQTFPWFGLAPCAWACASDMKLPCLVLPYPSCAGAVVHFTGCIDPNLTGAPRARSGTLAGCGCRLGQRRARAGRGRTRCTPRLHTAMATACTGALRPGEGSAILARSSDGVCALCLDRAHGQE